MNFNLNAREEISLDLKGTIAVDSARELLPAGLDPLVVNEITPVCLQLAHVERINWDMAPFIKMHFDKALWHIGVTFGDKKGWYLAVCELNQPFIRHMSNAFFRYPVRDANFTFMEKRKSLVTHHQPDTGGEMRCHIELGTDELPPEPIRPFYIKRKGGIHEIEVKEETPAFCRLSKADIIKDEISREIFGYPVEWEKNCYVYRGRTLIWEDITPQLIALEQETNTHVK